MTPEHKAIVARGDAYEAQMDAMLGGKIPFEEWQAEHDAFMCWVRERNVEQPVVDPEIALFRDMLVALAVIVLTVATLCWSLL